MSWTPETAIKAELQPGERLRWIGSPTFGPMLANRFFGFMFPLAFGAVFGFQMFDDKVSGGGFVVVGITTVVLLGFAMGAAWPLFAVGRTAYAVTDRRLLIVRDLLWRKVIAVSPNGINILEHRAQADGSGSVTFRRDVDESSESSTVIKLTFVGVRDVANAVREIGRLRDAAQ